MTILKTLTLTAAALCVLTSEARADELSGSEIEALMAGKRIEWATPDGKTRGTAKYRRNGTATAKFTEPDAFNDTGTWRIKDNTFCTQWQKIREGKEACSTVRTTKEQGMYRTDTVFFRVK